MVMGLLVFALFLGLIIALPYLLDLNRYRDQYLPLLESTLQRKVDMADVRMSLFPRLGLQVKDFQIADDPAFSQTPFLVLPSAEIVVSWKPLLQKKVQVEQVLVHDPHIHVIRTKDGTLNTASIGRVSSRLVSPSHNDEQAKEVNPLLGVFAVENLSLSGGQLTYEDRRDKNASFYSVENLVLTTESVQWGKTATIQGEGILLPWQTPIHLKGHVGPLQPTLDIPLIDFEGNLGKVDWSAKGELVKGTLDIDVQVPRLATDDIPQEFSFTKPVVVSPIHAHVQMPVLSSTGTSSPSGIRIHSFKADLHLGNTLVHLVGEGTPSVFHVQGTASALSTQDLPINLPLAKPVVFDQLDIHSTIRGAQIEVPVFEAKLFHGVLKGKGEWAYSGTSSVFSSHGTLNGFAVEAVQAALHPSPFGMTGIGDIQWDIKGLLGDASHPQLSGPVKITVGPGEISGVDILNMLENALSMPGLFSGTPGSTAITQLQVQAEGHPQGLHIKQAAVDSTDFSVHGRGMIGWDNRVNIQGEFLFPQRIAKKIFQRFPLAKVAKKEKGLSLPFVVKGTTQAPSFLLDTQSLGKQLQQKVNQAIEKMLQGDEKDMQELLKDGRDLLRKFLRP
ncbi:MAG: AsmA family protein [Nitrospirales bacterium]